MVMRLFYFSLSVSRLLLYESSVIVKNIESGAKLFGFKAQLYYLLAV